MSEIKIVENGLAEGIRLVVREGPHGEPSEIQTHQAISVMTESGDVFEITTSPECCNGIRVTSRGESFDQGFVRAFGGLELWVLPRFKNAIDVVSCGDEDDVD